MIHHSSDKLGLKVADCTVQSAEYWCFYGTTVLLENNFPMGYILEYYGIFQNTPGYYGIFQIIVIPLYSRVFQNITGYKIHVF